MLRRTVFDVRRAGPDAKVVAGLRESMARIGLLNPIVVQRFAGGMQWKLIAGRNRLEAARELRWPEIDGRELPEMESTATAEIDGSIAEIDENLERRELDAIERAELVARRVEMVEARKQIDAEARQVGALRKPGMGAGAKGGVRQTARDLGVPEQRVRRSLAIAALPPETKARAADLGLAGNQAALLGAAKHPEPAAQVAALEKRAGKAPVAPEPLDVALAALDRFAVSVVEIRTWFEEISGHARSR